MGKLNVFEKAKGGAVAVCRDGAIWTKAYDGDRLTGPGWTRPLGTNMLQHRTDQQMQDAGDTLYCLPREIAEKYGFAQEATHEQR